MAETPSLPVAIKSESERRPIFSDLLTDYNTVKNVDIPPPLWATLDADYCDMVGLPAPPERNRIESENGAVVNPLQNAIMKADGTPLRRVPLIRAAKHFAIEDDDDDENRSVIVAQPRGSLRELKAAAARRRQLDRSAMAIATDEAKARVAAAREAGSEEMGHIEEWGNAIVALNKQRDEEVIRIIEEQRRQLSDKQERNMRIECGVLDAENEDESGGRFVELEEDKESVVLAPGLARLGL